MSDLPISQAFYEYQMKNVHEIPGNWNVYKHV